MKKKILTLLMSLLTALSLTACSSVNNNEDSTNTGQNQAKEVVESFFKYIKEGDLDQLVDLVENSIVDDLGIKRIEDAFNQFDVDTYGEIFIKETNKFEKYLFENLFEDVTIGKITEDDDEIRVEVEGKFKIYDSVSLDGDLMNNLISNYYSDHQSELEQIYNEQGSDAYRLAVYEGIAVNYYASLKEKILANLQIEKFTSTFTLQLKDDQWYISNVDGL